MHFDPVVIEDGNLNLKTIVSGNWSIEYSAFDCIKNIRDSVKLPPWMIVRPKEEEIFIDLSKLPVSGNLKVRAKDI